MINATVGRINRYSTHSRPGGTGAIERMTDDKIIYFTTTAEATVSPDNIDRPRAINLGSWQWSLAQTSRHGMMFDRGDGGDRAPTGPAIGGIEGTDSALTGVINGHDH